MIVTLTNGETHEMDPVTQCTGYRARKIEMKAKDFEQLRILSELDPDQCSTVLAQLSGRLVPQEKLDKIDRFNKEFREVLDLVMEDPYQMLTHLRDPLQEVFDKLGVDVDVDEAIARYAQKEIEKSEGVSMARQEPPIANNEDDVREMQGLLGRQAVGRMFRSGKPSAPVVEMQDDSHLMPIATGHSKDIGEEPG